MPKETPLRNAIAKVEAIVKYEKSSTKEQEKLVSPQQLNVNEIALLTKAATEKTPESFYTACGIKKNAAPAKRLDLYRKLKTALLKSSAKDQKATTVSTAIEKITHIHNQLLLILANKILVDQNDNNKLIQLLGFGKTNKRNEKLQKIYNIYFHPDKIKCLPNFQEFEKILQGIKPDILMQLIAKAADNVASTISHQKISKKSQPLRSNRNKKAKTSEQKAESTESPYKSEVAINISQMINSSGKEYLNLYLTLPACNLHNTSISERLAILHDAIKLQQVEILARLLKENVFSNLFYDTTTNGEQFRAAARNTGNNQVIEIIEQQMAKINQPSPLASSAFWQTFNNRFASHKQNHFSDPTFGATSYEKNDPKQSFSSPSFPTMATFEGSPPQAFTADFHKRIREENFTGSSDFPAKKPKSAEQQEEVILIQEDVSETTPTPKS